MFLSAGSGRGLVSHQFPTLFSPVASGASIAVVVTPAEARVGGQMARDCDCSADCLSLPWPAGRSEAELLIGWLILMMSSAPQLVEAECEATARRFSASPTPHILRSQWQVPPPGRRC